MLHHVLFIIFGMICVAGAINLVAQRHPINSALSLVVVMGSLAMIYLLLGAEFLAAIQVIVYAGAIMVLFVFVIMLLNAGEEERTQGNHFALWLGAPAVATLSGMLMWIVFRNDPHKTVALGNMLGSPDNTHGLANLLFTKYLLPFEITSVLILIAIMGAVVLSKKEG